MNTTTIGSKIETSSRFLIPRCPALPEIELVTTARLFMIEPVIDSLLLANLICYVC